MTNYTIARNEIADRGMEISELSHLVISLKEKENEISYDDVIDNILSITDRIEWDNHFRELIKKLLAAQNRYI